MNDEDFETAFTAFMLFGGLMLVMAASMALIGFWGSVLWIGSLMTGVGIALL